MTPEEIEAIAGGYHGDAFRILGPHAVRKRGGQPRWEVRTFLPQAESAALVAGGKTTPMEKHDAGFFWELFVPGLGLDNLSCGNLVPPPSSGDQLPASLPSALQS
jgi:hypothetical protein